MSVPLDKMALRKEIRARRKAFVTALPDSVRGLAFRVLPSPVMAMIPPGSRIAIYRSMGFEAPTDNLIDFLYERGFPLCLPRLGADTSVEMEFAAWDPDDILVPGQLKIPQPMASAETVVPDVVLTPLVGFDAQLNRMGNGAGYYDRYFARHDIALRIGIAWSAQMVDTLPLEPWDVPLHMILTEQAIYERPERLLGDA